MNTICFSFLAFTLLVFVRSEAAWPSWFLDREPQRDAAVVLQGRKLQHTNSSSSASHCGPLTRELVQRVARDNTVLVTVIDKIVWKCFGPSYVENIQASNITYWLIAALDPETSKALAAMGVTQCFNAPIERLKYKGSDDNYRWGGHHWVQTTWNKVHIMKHVYEHGVHIIHSDADVVWFNDPLPYFHARLDGPVDIVLATDAVVTGNKPQDVGLEMHTNPHTNINTGIYFMRQYPAGLAFFDVWLSWQDKNVGHDQDGFNFVARGQYFHGNAEMPTAYMPPDAQQPRYHAAFHNATVISFLPASMFGNTYTYVNTRLWEKLSHPLYAVHWVWGGKTMESKRQCMRDARKFHDDPGYYSEPYLVTFDLEQLQMPSGFNSWGIPRTEEMIRFHVTSANHQLQQTYFAIAIALIANRTLVMPRFQCYCSKNWYQTQACRLNHETATTFPFVCALSHLMRVKRLQGGLSLPDSTQYSGHRVFIREYSFLENPKVPDQIQRSFLEIVPSPQPRPPGLRPDQLVLSSDPSPRGPGLRLTVAAPLTDGELRTLLEQHRGVRVLHFPQPGRTLAGFERPATARQYDMEIQKYVTYWCCRSPADMKAVNLTDKMQFVALPPDRYKNLPFAEPRSSYLHELDPTPVFSQSG